MFGKNDNLMLIAIAFVILVLALGACVVRESTVNVAEQKLGHDAVCTATEGRLGPVQCTVNGVLYYCVRSDIDLDRVGCAQTSPISPAEKP